jgi:serine/threonine protein kinase/tetratricopeptide (TPR) repeat protein
MQAERWRQIDHIFNSALKIEESRRAAFLEDTCSGDEGLRLELERLLAHNNEAGTFLESPALELAAQALAERLPSESGGSSALTGETFSHYRILSRLGSGGMGVVYEAEDIRLGRRVALKFLSEHLARDRGAMQRFEREARAASSLNHANICTIYEVEEHNQQPVIVMELLEGESLKQRMAGGPIPTDELLDLGIQISDALEAAHAKGITHRDIKPENIFIVGAARVKVLDFGLAKLNPAPDAEDQAGAESLTREGAIAGTISYMSPEQARGEEIDVRSDLFSLGVVLYEMATAHRPFARKNKVLTADAILHERPPGIGSLNPALPAALDTIVARTLEKDRELRYQHAADICSDLKGLRHGKESARVLTTGKPGAKHWKVMIAAAAAVPALFAAGYFYFHRAPKLTSKDTIVLADFRNTTGDLVFDGALRQGLALELEQSPYLSLISDARIQRTMAQMKQPADSRLTPALAREICERTASAAFLEGSIERLGSQYVLGLRAENCHTGDVLADEQARASRKEDVLDALTHVASRFRTRVGEALATVRQHETPLDEATTPSLEALKAYSTATKLNYTRGPAAAIPHLQRAIAIDPQFAIAYAYLGLMYSITGEGDLAATNTRHAYELRDRAGDREKFFIALTYDRQLTGNLEKEGETAAMWAQTYPRDAMAHGLWAGYVTQGTGQYEKTIEEAEITIGLDPDQVYAYTSVVNGNLRLGRFPEAEKALARAAANHMDMSHSGFCTLRFQLAFLRNDRAGMDREMAQSRGRSGVEDAILHNQALVLARAGRLREAGETWQRARELARQTGKREAAGIYEAAAAVCDAVCGRTAEARKRAHAALELSKGRDVEYGAAFALAVAGDSAVSQALAGDLKKRFPEDTSVRFSYLPTLDALFALAHGDHAGAIETLQLAHTHEFGMTGIAFLGYFGGLHPGYVRGGAYLAAHQGVEAAAEFQKIIDHPGIVISDPMGALARLQLGRALALAGDKARARTAYEDFLTLWNDADADIPILRQATAEYGRLR